MRVLAKVLALLWGGWWMLYATACWTLAGSPVAQVIVNAVPFALMTGTALVACKWERVGGTILLVEGAALAIGYIVTYERLHDTAMYLTTVALPPIISGLILIRKRPTPIAVEN